jgi:hypothetical protein
VWSDPITSSILVSFPPMNIKQIDIVSSQVLEGIFEGKMERFRIITSVDNLVSSLRLA